MQHQTEIASNSKCFGQSAYELPTEVLRGQSRTAANMEFCVIAADEYILVFLLLTSTLYFQLGSGSGWRITEYRHIAKP